MRVGILRVIRCTCSFRRFVNRMVGVVVLLFRCGFWRFGDVIGTEGSIE